MSNSCSIFQNSLSGQHQDLAQIEESLREFVSAPNIDKQQALQKHIETLEEKQREFFEDYSLQVHSLMISWFNDYTATAVPKNLFDTKDLFHINENGMIAVDMGEHLSFNLSVKNYWPSLVRTVKGSVAFADGSIHSLNNTERVEGQLQVQHIGEFAAPNLTYSLALYVEDVKSLNLSHLIDVTSTMHLDSVQNAFFQRLIVAGEVFIKSPQPDGEIVFHSLVNVREFVFLEQTNPEKSRYFREVFPVLRTVVQYLRLDDPLSLVLTNF